MARGGRVRERKFLTLIRIIATVDMLIKLSKCRLESQNFFLLHLSLFREYLDLEFADLKSTLPFPYSLESVIDDFILLSIFVGNDFLPHLPDLHINEGALELLFGIYKNILPGAGGYLNEGGTLRVDRLQLLIAGLQDFERAKLEEAVGDVGPSQIQSAAKSQAKAAKKARSRGDLVLTPSQKDVFDQVKTFVEAQRFGTDGTPSEVTIPSDKTAAVEDRAFLQKLTENLHLKLSLDDYDPETDETKTTVGVLPNWGDDDSSSDETDPVTLVESQAAIDRVLKKYSQARIETTAEAVEEDLDKQRQDKLDTEIRLIKTSYYKDKMDIDLKDHEAINQLAYRYIEGLQWVLLYYYRGVVSWGWFYDYHYAPRISDISNVGDMKFRFDQGEPFKPFAQLMGVLPPLSKALVPVPFQQLMTDPSSPVIDFYPMNFESDQNGKKASWEAVVKIPFIDEKRLLHELEKRDALLTDEEHYRNSFQLATSFEYDEAEEHPLHSSLPGVFPDLLHARTKVQPFIMPPLQIEKLHHNLCKGVHLGVEALPGFPTLQTLPYAAELDFHHVNLFQQDSRNQSIVIHVEDRYARATTEDVAKATIGKRTFLNWPFLQEALVVGVSDEYFKHETGLIGGKRAIVANEHTPESARDWARQAHRIEHTYDKRFGVVIGKVNILLHTRPLKGLQLMDDSSFLKDYERDPKNEVPQALQLAVSAVNREDPRYVERKALPLQREFPFGEHVFFLGKDLYGSPATVVASNKSALALEVRVFVLQAKENQALAKIVHGRTPDKYFASSAVARILHTHPLALARVTSSLLVQHKDSRVNLGLNLKFEARSLKVLGYSRKNLHGWEFSEKAVELIREYKTAFPEVFEALSASRGRDDIRTAEDVFGANAAARMETVKAWTKEKKVRDLEAVPLFAEQLDRESVQIIEGFTERMGWVRAAQHSEQGHSPTNQGIKSMVIKNIPRLAVLKPSHASFRLGGQKFSLGDRLVVVQDSGSVPLAAMGVVVGLNTGTIDAVFDFPFLGGTNLQGRCRPHCGATVQFHQVLNVSAPQFVAENNTKGSALQAQQDALTRTLHSAPGRISQGNGGSAFHRDHRGSTFSTGPVSKPPSGFVPAKGQPRILSRPPGQQPQSGVLAGTSYSATASGQAQPSQIRAQTSAAVDPRLALLNGTTVPPLSAQPMPPSFNSRGRGRGRGRGGARRGHGGHDSGPAA